jgi:hypothetical protein
MLGRKPVLELHDPAPGQRLSRRSWTISVCVLATRVLGASGKALC